MEKLVELHHGDCLEVLRAMQDNSIDSIVTDPPYGLSFLGKRWDYDVPSEAIWRECLRVLKPGGHLLAFAGTRTQHRMAVRIEDAGFEIRDMIAWVYGCLDEATEVATEKGVMPYHKAKIGDRVLCYDVEHGEYTYQPILEIVEYDYSDTAFRLVGDFGEQVVSRNHRVIVERGGSEAFQIAETLECEARVPVLESLPALRKAIYDAHQGAGRPQQDAHDGRIQSGLEGRADISESQGCVCGSADQVCALSSADAVDGAVGRLRDGTSLGCCAGDQPTSDEIGVCSPHQSRCDGQQAGQPDVVCDQRAAQGVRAWSGHKTAVVRVVPFHYTGKVWCLRVPTGAFVAVRNGVAFPTGNSGFPKSLDVSKAIDKAAGAERIVPAGRHAAVERAVGIAGNDGRCVTCGRSRGGQPGNCQCPKHSPPVTDAARQWQGWGTALKPSLEPVTVARKPLAGTVAENVLTHGTGALNIDGCRVDASDGRPLIESKTEASLHTFGNGLNGSRCAGTTTLGRWPANLIHDGSEEVLSLFPDTKGGVAVRSNSGGNTFGGDKAKPPMDDLGYGDSGSAARFFKECNEWQDRSQALSNADIVPSNLCLQSVVGATVQSVAATWPSLAGIVSSDSKEPSTSATAGECESIAAVCTAAMVVIGSGCSQESRHEKRTQSGSLASAVATQKPTGITTITASLLKSDGSVGRATFSITPTSLDRGDLGSRFKYCAKASKSDRGEGNGHPTVKPTDSMRYLCRLVTPPGGVVLDPFMGSGSTGKAAVLEGFRFVGIEREGEYLDIAEARIEAALGSLSNR